MTATDHEAAIREALHYGLEHFGHELDDVSARIHALTPEAKRFESAQVDLDALVGLLQQAKFDLAVAEAERDSNDREHDRVHELEDMLAEVRGLLQQAEQAHKQTIREDGIVVTRVRERAERAERERDEMRLMLEAIRDVQRLDLTVEERLEVVRDCARRAVLRVGGAERSA